jgi:hypothetical protein
MDLLELCTHGVAAVARALQRTNDLMLREFISELSDGEDQRRAYLAVNGNSMRSSIEHWYRRVIAVVSVVGRNEASKISVRSRHFQPMRSGEVSPGCPPRHHCESRYIKRA